LKEGLHHSPPLIAVVEDDESVRKALARLLRSSGLDVDAYASGEEFLMAMPEHLPECVLLDLQLPGMNGLEVQARLRDSWPKLPVIFITAAPGLEVQQQAMEAGAAAWLLKPVDDLALLEVISRLLSGKNVLPNS
jgi:FixJ family two-component response regulator